MITAHGLASCQSGWGPGEGDSACKTLSSPHPGPFYRYWLSYEVHLVETSPKDTVNMSFLKALVLNISTNISKDLHFSLAASQVKGPHPCGLALTLLSSGTLCRESQGLCLVPIAPVHLVVHCPLAHGC